MSNHETYMARAIELARKGLYSTMPNPRVGCVLVGDNKIIAEGYHEYYGGKHAEIMALDSIKHEAVGATCYVTLEPCSHFGKTPPCAKALVNAGIKTVVIAQIDPNPLVSGSGIQYLKEHGVEVIIGVLDKQSEALNLGFNMRMRNNRPYVRLKLAMSLDGKTAMSSGESKYITGEAARAEVHDYRAQSCAILTGIGTVIADDPLLSARVDHKVKRQPIRIILDSNLQTPVDAKCILLPGTTLIFTCKNSDKAYPNNVEIIKIKSLSNRVDLTAVLEELSNREINELWLESGHVLSGAFLLSRLVDEMIIYVAPKLIGANGISLLDLPSIEKLTDALKLDISSIDKIGVDWRFRITLAS